MKGPLLPGEHADTIRNTPANYDEMTNSGRLNLGEPYDGDLLSTQEIRDDFLDLVAVSDYYDLLKTFAVWLPGTQLAEFIDDRSMGRI